MLGRCLLDSLATDADRERLDAGVRHRGGAARSSARWPAPTATPRAFEIRLTNLTGDRARRRHPAQRPRRLRAQGVRGRAHPPGVPRHADRARQPADVHRAHAPGARPRAPRGEHAGGAVPRPRRLQGGQRLARPRGRRRGPDRGRAPPRRRRAQRRHRRALRRRRVRDPARGRRQPGAPPTPRSASSTCSPSRCAPAGARSPLRTSSASRSRSPATRARRRS